MRTNKLVGVLLACAIVLSGCSTLASLAKSGGVNTNAQVGKENTQQVVAVQKTEEITVKDTSGETQVIKSETSVTAKQIDKVIKAGDSKSVIARDTTSAAVLAEKIEEVKTISRSQEVKAGPNSSVIVNQNDRYPAWLIMLLVIGWVLPTPVDICKRIINWYNKRF